MSRQGVSRISVSVPPDLLDTFDEAIDQLGYTRSKAIQFAMHDFLTEYRARVEGRGLVVGTLNMIYNHEIRDLEESLTNIQHRYREIISSTTHIHLDEQNCLEIVAVKGEGKVIQSLARELMAQRGVKQLKLAILTF